ncbi:MAG: hypothetical protein QUS14_07845 [Pyrinomonadaceae bacterium]|nr:hypothetical protein [Pyrinomonadaceae bacterium]
MRIDNKIANNYRKSVEQAFETIIERGTDEQRRVMKLILESEMEVRVRPVSKINASGITGLIDPGETNDKISDGRIGLLEALGEVYIAIAEETIDTGGQRGCEGTFVHEGRHAYDFARTIESFSTADVNPLSVFDPTLYELELEAHRTSGEYMLRIGADEYLLEGLQLMILGRTEESGACFVDHEGIHCRLRDSYGLTPDGNQGPLASQLLGLKQR